MPDSFYQHHVFLCENQREPNAARGCCADKQATMLREYLKNRVKELKLNGKGKIRVNMSGCLDRCEQGPVMVIYPQEVWYRPESIADVEEILQSHLINGRPVERLML